MVPTTFKLLGIAIYAGLGFFAVELVLVLAACCGSDYMLKSISRTMFFLRQQHDRAEKHHSGSVGVSNRSAGSVAKTSPSFLCLLLPSIASLGEVSIMDFVHDQIRACRKHSSRKIVCLGRLCACLHGSVAPQKPDFYRQFFKPCQVFLLDPWHHRNPTSTGILQALSSVRCR